MDAKSIDKTKQDTIVQFNNALNFFKTAYVNLRSGFDAVVSTKKSFSEFTDILKLKEIESQQPTEQSQIQIYTKSNPTYDDNTELDASGRLHPYLVPTNIEGVYSITRSKKEFMKYVNSVLHLNNLDNGSVVDQFACLLDHGVLIECLAQALELSMKDIEDIGCGRSYPYLNGRWMQYFNTNADWHPLEILRKKNELKNTLAIFKDDSKNSTKTYVKPVADDVINRVVEAVMNAAPISCIDELVAIVNNLDITKQQFMHTFGCDTRLLNNNIMHHTISATLAKAINDKLGEEVVIDSESTEYDEDCTSPEPKEEIKPCKQAINRSSDKFVITKEYMVEKFSQGAPYTPLGFLNAFAELKVTQSALFQFCGSVRGLFAHTSFGKKAIKKFNTACGFTIIEIKKEVVKPEVVKKDNKLPITKESTNESSMNKAIYKTRLIAASKEPMEGTVANIFALCAEAKVPVYSLGVLCGITTSNLSSNRLQSRLRSSTCTKINEVLGKEVFISTMKTKKKTSDTKLPQFTDIQLKELLRGRVFSTHEEFSMFMKEHKITQAALANSIGVSRQYINFIASGEKSMLSCKRLIVNKFKCTFEY